MDNYEKFVSTTDLSGHGIQFYLDGMVEETGEVVGVFKRVRRGDYGEWAKKKAEEEGIDAVIKAFPEVKKDLMKELGDVHWYGTRLLQVMETDWVTIRQMNLDKLKKRKKTGTIMGQGDNREDEVS